MEPFISMTTKQHSRGRWYRLGVGLLAAFCWAVAVAAFVRAHSDQSTLFTLTGWALGLAAFVLVANLLGQMPSSHLPPDAEA